MVNLAAIAEELWQARLSRKPCPSLTERFSDLTLEQAYAISKQNYERRLKAGTKPLGRKIGLTSKAVQNQLGVKEPDFGYITQDMLLEDGAEVSVSTLLQSRAEGEVVFFLSKDLPQEYPSFEEVVAATDHVRVAIEIIDSRVKDWKIKIQDTVADNASSALLVLGPEKHFLKNVDLEMAGMSLTKNGEVVSTGVGRACLGHPVLAVQWLARTMARLGDPLKAGDCILSGAYGPVVAYKSSEHCRVEINGLGKVECRWVD